ncbi:MAG: cell division protein FtsL [Deltaproteobacteria bacterium]|nr:cell division protein FtsL [Deltaproteobacteria bacterium]
MNRSRPFLVLWTLAVLASVAAFVLHLGLRGRIFKLGYEMGKERSEQARLREAKRVLELEVASFQNPQRVEVIAKTLLGMQPPTPDRIIPMRSIDNDQAQRPEREGDPAAPHHEASAQH